MASFKPSPVGGAELQAFNLAKALKYKGFDVCIITLGQKGLSTKDIIEGIPVFRIRLFFSPFYYRTSRKQQDGSAVKIEYTRNDRRNFELSDKKSVLSLVNYLMFFLSTLRLLRHRKVDLIYVPMVEWLAFVASLLGKALKKNVVIKDSTMNGMTNLFRYPMGVKMKKTIVEHCHFVAMTKAIRENFLRAGIKAERISSIPNGVLVPELTALQMVNKNRFIFVGNLNQQPAKGIDVLLRAWKFVTDKLPAAQLSVVGDGNLDAYRRYARGLGIDKNVRFLGKQKDVSRLLRESFAFILPSRREGMSNALLEAMALGLPCIATDISGNQDLITNHVNGILVPTEDELALAEAVEYLYKHPETATSMGARARTTIELGYTIDSVTARYQELFQHTARKII